MTEKKKFLRAALSLLLILLILAVLSSFLIIQKAVRSLSYDPADETPPFIDPAYAAGNGIRFPDREMIHNSHVINVLFLGTDYRLSNEERGRADSNILCSLNTRSGEIRLISFERGIGVPVPGRGSDLLTHAYHWGGPALSQSIISQMFCVEVIGYVQVDFETFAKIIDSIGGIDVELNELEAKALNGEIPSQTWVWQEVHEGWNHLFGHDALEYCRLRSIDSDWNRQRRQRTVLQQIQKSCKSLSPSDLLRLSEQVLPLIHTNLREGQITSILLHLPKLMRGDVTQLQVPDKNNTDNYIRCNPDYESKKIANFLYDAGYELVSPY